jgi:nucleoside-diphosphate-sugar epimerase
MKLFMTGASGRLGRAVAQEAQRQGMTLVGVDIRGWPQGEEMPKCLQLHVGNALEMVDRLMPGCDGVIHSAGLHGADLERATLAEFIEANVTGVARLLGKAREHGVKGVALSSTMEVLIGRSGTAGGLTVLDEESPVKCDSAYSTSKFLMEGLGACFAREHGLWIASLRYMAFGYSSEFAGGARLLSRLLPSQDAARAAILAATTPGLAGEVINIGPVSPITLEEVPEVLADPAGVLERHFPGAKGVLEARGNKVQASDLLPATSTRKAQERLGWSPSWTFAHWLERNRNQTMANPG